MLFSQNITRILFSPFRHYYVWCSWNYSRKNIRGYLNEHFGNNGNLARAISGYAYATAHATRQQFAESPLQKSSKSV